MASNSDRRIPHVRDVFSNATTNGDGETANDDRQQYYDEKSGRAKHKYKTLERHLSMKKTIRKKMMRDLREIGDAEDENSRPQDGFLDKLRSDQPPTANVDKPSFWKRLTKGWSGTNKS